MVFRPVSFLPYLETDLAMQVVYRKTLEASDIFSTWVETFAGSFLYF